MKTKRLLALLSAGALSVSMLAGCGSTAKTDDTASGSAAADTSASADSDLEYVKGKGKLVVGITDFAPMDYKDKDGKWIGFDADNATAFAKSLGVDVEFIEVDWDNKIMEL
ncbi:MAG: transporter substrate-binding domain-containing protein, partial [Agathobaculum sp.]|nr:transporter substrate-binding domain-containing protein [Agathobaculum sp.]